MVQPELQPLANDNSPIAVDIVTVADKKTLDEVSKFSARTWFAQKQDYVRMHPSRVRVASWEWVPGERVDAVRVTGTAGAKGVILFANYSTPGAHAAVLPARGTIEIDFGATDFALPTGAK
jgi:type VI secretion system protein